MYENVYCINSKKLAHLFVPYFHVFQMLIHLHVLVYAVLAGVFCITYSTSLGNETRWVLFRGVIHFPNDVA